MSAIRPYEPTSSHWDTARERDVDAQLDAEERELDSREKLKEDVDKFCLGLSDSGTVVGTEPLNRIRNVAARWLDRQATITELECMTASGLAATEAPKLQAKVDELTDERDKLRRQVALNDGIIEGLRESLDETIAERNELVEEVDRLAKEVAHLEGQCEECDLWPDGSGWMRLPVDADVVPIRPGDTVTVGGGEIHVGAVGIDGFNSAPLFCARDAHHVQPDTVELLLDEFMVALHELGEGADYGPTKERMAERIRKAVHGGD